LAATAGSLTQDRNNYLENGELVSTGIRDMSERKQIDELRTELGFEKTLSEVSRIFIDLQA
jgi:hypothetical protein